LPSPTRRESDFFPPSCRSRARPRHALLSRQLSTLTRRRFQASVDSLFPFPFSFVNTSRSTTRATGRAWTACLPFVSLGVTKDTYFSPFPALPDHSIQNRRGLGSCFPRLFHQASTSPTSPCGMQVRATAVPPAGSKRLFQRRRKIGLRRSPPLFFLFFLLGLSDRFLP